MLSFKLFIGEDEWIKWKSIFFQKIIIIMKNIKK
jgi:hypothetical protein